MDGLECLRVQCCLPAKNPKLFLEEKLAGWSININPNELHELKYRMWDVPINISNSSNRSTKNTILAEYS